MSRHTGFLDPREDESEWPLESDPQELETNDKTAEERLDKILLITPTPSANMKRALKRLIMELLNEHAAEARREALREAAELQCDMCGGRIGKFNLWETDQYTKVGDTYFHAPKEQADGERLCYADKIIEQLAEDKHE